MIRAAWDSARHTLTIVTQGATSTVRADLLPSFTLTGDAVHSFAVRFTPPFQLTPPVATFLYYVDDTQMVYTDDTAMEYA